MRLRLLVFLPLLVAGCSYQQGFVRDAASAQIVKYELKPRAVTYLRSVRGEARTDALFCLIQMDSTSLYADAMKELHGAAKLQRGQTLMNLREDSHLTSYLGFYCIRRLVVSGDVMDVVGGGAATAVPPSRDASAPRSTSTLAALAGPAEDHDAATPGVKAGAAAGTGAPDTGPRLSRAQIRKGIAGVLPSAKDCYNQHQKPGTYPLKLIVAPNGAVTSVGLHRSIAGTTMGRCLKKVILKARFAPFKGAPLSVIYPLRFE